MQHAARSSAVIPGVNDSPEEMERIRTFLDGCGKPEKVELLPYHPMGEHKYSALGIPAQRFAQPAEEQMTRLRGIF